jgi:hypothetical protein
LKKALFAVTWALLFSTCGILPGVARAEEELAPPSYMVVVDEGGRPVSSTCHILRLGDELLTSDNRRYRIVRVEKYRAVARLVAQENLDTLLGPEERAAIARLLVERERPPAEPRWWAWWNRLRGIDWAAREATPARAQNTRRVVGIYHTHSDET